MHKNSDDFLNLSRYVEKIVHSNLAHTSPTAHFHKGININLRTIKSPKHRTAQQFKFFLEPDMYQFR